MVYYSAAASFQDTYRITSADAGATWSSPVKLSTAPSDLTFGPEGTTKQAKSFGEWLGVASTDANVFAAWTDSRDPRIKQDVFVTKMAP